MNQKELIENLLFGRLAMHGNEDQVDDVLITTVVCCDEDPTKEFFVDINKVEEMSGNKVINKLKKL